MLRSATRTVRGSAVRVFGLMCMWKFWTINEFTQEIDEETKRVRNDTKWRERIVTWEMDLRIIKKRAHEKGKQEGIDIGKQEVAEALRKKGMSEAEIAEVTGLPEKKETLK